MAPVSAFASAYLLFRGFNNSQIGVVTALGSIGATILQMAIGSFAGGGRKLSVRAMTVALLVVLLALSLLLCVMPSEMTMIAVIYVAIMVLALALQPLVSSMNFLFQNHGIKINFGLARAAGSIAYAILSAVIGSAVARYSGAAIPWFNILTFGGMLLFVAGFHLPKAAAEALPNGSVETVLEKAAPQVKTQGFFRRNRGFLPFLAGVSLMFLNLAAIQMFFLQIIVSKGGDSVSLGIVMSIGAALEIPMMVGFAWLSRKAKCSVLVQASALFFTVKTIVILFAPDVNGLYFAQILHMFGYALFTPASVYYVDQMMGEGDKVKGQAYLGSTMAIGSIAASFAGGRILDAYGPEAMLRCVIALSAIGNVIVILAVRAIQRKADHCAVRSV
jgi:PPP family 3-phenylpropionic acid transporter